MTSKEIEEILKSPITKAAKGRFISIEELEQIKTDLEAWEVVKKRLIRKKYCVFHSKDCSVHNYTRIYLKEIKEDENPKKI